MPSVINGREWRDDDQARSQAVEAEPRELKRTKPMTRNQLRELCVTLCDRFPFVSDNRWLGPSIGKPCGPSSPVLKIAFGCDPCRQTEDTVALGSKRSIRSARLPAPPLGRRAPGCAKAPRPLQHADHTHMKRVRHPPAARTSQIELPPAREGQGNRVGSSDAGFHSGQVRLSGSK